MKLRHLTLALGVAMIFNGPTAAEEPAQSGPAQLTLDDLRTFTDVFNQVRNNYVEELDDKTLLNAAIHGMVSGLDRYSSFHEAEDFKILDNSSRGRYGGIGIEVEIHRQRISVARVFPEGPADQAGLQEGDVITAIDGVEIRGRPLQQAIDELRGEPGTEVSIRFKSPNKIARTVMLKREFIPVASVTSKWLAEGFAYFRITHFHEQSHSDLKSAIREMQSTEGSVLRGLVLDLRNNMGGVLQPAVTIADGFLEAGRITYTRGRRQSIELEFNAQPGEWTPGIPLVVVVNKRTASASEVLAGALQDNGRAVIVGEQTFGKGSVQSVIALRNGAALRLTTAYYFTPGGISIDKAGIAPDLSMTGTDDEVLEQALEQLQKMASG